MKRITKKIMPLIMLICMIFSSLQTPLVVLADSINAQDDSTPQKGDIRLGENGEISNTGSVSITKNNGITGEGAVSVTKTVSKVNDDGKYRVTFNIVGEEYSTSTSTTLPSYTVFVLDASGSMKGIRWTNAKTAAINFSQKLIEAGQYTEDGVVKNTNNIALVTFAGSLVVSKGFSQTAFTNSDLGDTETGTDYQAGFDQAYAYLNALSNEIKTGSSLNVIFISDGQPNEGNCTSISSCSTSLAALKNLGDGVNVYTFAYELYGTTATNLLKSISTNNKVESVTSDNIDSVLAGFVETVSGSTPAGTTSSFEDGVGNNFKVVKSGTSYDFGESYVDNTQTTITEDGMTITFDIQINTNAETGWHNTNDGFELVYVDSKTNQTVKIVCDENPQVYWESYRYQVNYYKDSITDSNFLGSVTTKVDKNTVVTSSDININKYLSDAGEGYEFNSLTPETITVNNPLVTPVINVLYTLKEYTYKVQYYYDNVLTDEINNIGPVVYGTEVEPTNYYLSSENIREGYQLDTINTDKETVVIDSENEIIKIYYIKDSFNYTVNYHFGEEETIDNTNTNNTGSAEFGSVINPEDKYLSQEELTNKGYGDYFLNPIKPHLPKDGLVIGVDSSKNVIDVYYVTTEVEDEITTKKADKTLISSSSELISYTVNYQANVKYVQEGEKLIVTIIDTLPKKIDESKSNLNGGIYDKESNTITWTFELTVDEYTENYSIDKTVTYTVNYLDFANMSSSINNMLLNTVKGTITIDSDTSDGSEDEEEVTVAIDGTLIVKHVDEMGNDLVPSVTTTDKVGTSYNESKKDIYGYTIKTEPNNKSGEYIEGTITVTFVYSKNDGTITDNTVSKTGLETVTGVGEKFDYTLTYNAKVTDYVGEVTLTLTDKLPYEINLEKSTYDNRCIYNNQTLVCTEVIEINENNTEINEEFKLSLVFKNVDTDKVVNEVDAKLVYGDNEVENEDKTETEVLKGTVIATYKDTLGNVLADEVSSTDLAGKEYKTSEKTIYGYTLIETPENENGKYVADKTIYVEYVYSKNAGTVNKNEVIKTQKNTIIGVNSTFKYTLSYLGIVDNYVGEATVTLSDILPYEVLSINYPASCSYDESTRLLVCEKTVILDETNHEVSANFEIDVTYKNLTGTTSLTVLNKVESNLTFGETKVTDKSEVTDTIKNGEVIAKYLDENDQVLAQEEVSSGLVDTEYKTSEKTIYGYTLIETPENETGKYIDGTIYVEYIYSKNSGEVIDNTVEKTGLENITSIDGLFKYTLKYGAKVTNYVGEVTLTLTDKLPYEIDEVKSSFDNRCTYNGQTLTCIEVISIDENNQEIDETFDLSLVFKDITSNKVVNEVTAKLVYGDNEVENKDKTETEIFKGTVIATYKDTLGNVLADEVSSTDLAGKEYETSELEILGYTLTKTPENENGKYVANETIYVEYIYSKNIGTSEEELIKTGSDKVIDINTPFEYTITYNTEIFDYVGEVTIEIVDTPEHEIDEEKSSIGSNCQFVDGKIVCNYHLNIINKEDGLINITENFVLYYKNITDKVVNNKVSSTLTYGSNIKTNDSEWNSEVTEGTVIVNYVTDDGKKLADSQVMTDLVGKEYQTKGRAFDGYFLKEVQGEEKGTYMTEVINVTYVYSTIPLPPQTGIDNNFGAYINFFIGIICLFVIKKRIY